MSPQLRRLLRIGIGALTTVEVTTLAEEAFAASYGERHDDAIADPEFAVARPRLDDFTHRFMAKHIAVLHAGNNAVIDMQVGAADRACRYFHDCIARMLDPRIGHAFASHIAFAVPGQCPHVPLSDAQRSNATGRARVFQRQAANVSVIRPRLYVRQAFRVAERPSCPMRARTPGILRWLSPVEQRSIGVSAQRPSAIYRSHGSLARLRAPHAA